jgi:hypothetical protein
VTSVRKRQPAAVATAGDAEAEGTAAAFSREEREPAGAEVMQLAQGVRGLRPRVTEAVPARH